MWLSISSNVTVSVLFLSGRIFFFPFSFWLVWENFRRTNKSRGFFSFPPIMSHCLYYSQALYIQLKFVMLPWRQRREHKDSLRLPRKKEFVRDSVESGWETAGSDLDQARQLSLAKHPAHLCCLLCWASLLCTPPAPSRPSPDWPRRSIANLPLPMSLSGNNINFG